MITAGSGLKTMKILAIESSGTVAGAAVFEDGKIIAEGRGPFKVTHSETLMPLTDEVLKKAGIKAADVDLIAVSGGPGSFTGLRIGSATAKGLGFALGKKLVHVPTLDAMAYNFFGTDGIIVPMMDARRNQVYTGIYSFEGETLKVLKESCAMDAGELIDEISEKYADKPVTFLGDGAAAFEEIVKKCTAEYTVASGENLLQRASSVAKLAAVLADQGKTVDADFEAPDYLRPSQAERVRAEQEG